MSRTLLARTLVACGAFLIAVLWMDLMFDVQVLGHPDGALPDVVLGSIAAYYRRVTTDAHPMGHAVGAVMIVALAGALYQSATASASLWRRIAVPATAGLPIGLALAVVFPEAVQLGGGEGTAVARSELARAIFHAHAACLVSIAAFVWLQLSDGAGGGHPTRIERPARSPEAD